MIIGSAIIAFMAVEKLRQVLANFPSPDHQKQFCKPDKKSQCPYLMPESAKCGLNDRKFQRRVIGLPNCERILGVIKTYAQAFAGASLRYVDPPFFDATGTLKVLEIESGYTTINPEIEGLDITPQYTNPVIDIFLSQISFTQQSRMLDSTQIEIPNVDVEVVVPVREGPRFGRFDPRRYLSN